MKGLKRNSLAMAGMAVLVAVGVACTSSSPTPAASETPSMTITNVRVTTPTPAASPTPGEYVGSVSQGEALYTRQCVACHGSGGEGGFAPALSTPDFQQRYADDATLITLMRTGRGGMPAYASNRLTENEVSDLVVFLRSLQ
ncbi:MAG: cytochrome c [Dehalococcoidia bacterium]|nr:cytochrome c [Dehalococcoidia bacterium]